MATRVHVAVGYGHPVTVAGVSSDQITERKLYGVVEKNSRQLREGENLNQNLVVQNTVKVVADAYALDHFFAIKYAVWSGVAWEVTDVTVERPQLILRLGGVYNGPRSEAAPAAPSGTP